jgi:hypothetical protein
MARTSKLGLAPGCSIRQALLATAAAALALSPAQAMADCALQGRLRFSYPSEGTRQVPLDAVFWAVPEYGGVSFRLDGVELQRLDDSDEGRFQFVPSDALSPGMHDIEISVSATLQGEALEGETLQLRVEAVEQPRVEADATIEAVSHYPVIVDGIVRYPPPEETGEGCVELATLDLGCYDVTPESLTRVEFSARGNAIGYLLERAILPPSCRTYFPYEYSQGDSAPYTIRAILPTGLAAARVFEGDVPVIGSAASADADGESSADERARALAGAHAEPADSCALHVPASGASVPSLLWFVAAGAVASRLRRR